ncbi:MAG: tetratricopeptide repeat protein [Verrucomicrobiota bacterium]
MKKILAFHVATMLGIWLFAAGCAMPTSKSSNGSAACLITNLAIGSGLETTPYLRKLSQSIQKNPNDAGSLIKRGHVYSQLGQQQLAMADYKRALRLTPDDAYLHWSFGWSLFNAGESKEALRHWQLWIDKQKNRPWAADHTLALGFWATGQKFNALYYYDEAVKNNPDKFATKVKLLAYTEFWTRKERAAIEDVFDAWKRAYTVP